MDLCGRRSSDGNDACFFAAQKKAYSTSEGVRSNHHIISAYLMLATWVFSPAVMRVYCRGRSTKQRWKEDWGGARVVSSSGDARRQG